MKIVMLGLILILVLVHRLLQGLHEGHLALDPENT